MLLYIAALVLIKTSYALIGFDCGGQHLNVTSISLLDVGECNLNYRKTNSSNIYVQLLQLSDYNHAEVIQCKIEISRAIYHCGMHSHVSVVHNGKADYIHETGYTQCLRILQDGTFSLGAGNVIHGLKFNRTSFHSLTLAGRISNDGSCKGTQYSDPYGTWDNVVVQATVKISAKTSHVSVQLNSGKIILKSGTVCRLSESFCLDSDDGYTYRKPVPISSCDFHKYDVLYEGPATKITEDAEDPSSPIIYSLTTQDITFALTKTKEQPLCGYTLFCTEHPKLFIFETKEGTAFVNRGIIPVDNQDIFAYMNSKFVYVEKHIRQQMTSLYYNVMQQKCELERQVITNALSFATLQPDEFAYRLMKGPGYMAVTTGEVTHVIKCIPVDVTIRKTEECFTELPVTARNISLFLTPKSRIITKYGNQRECSYELPTMYRIEETWVQFTPEPQVRQLPPQQLRPMTALSWDYLTPSPLAVSGIYSEKDLEKLRDHIMFPAEKPALLNTVARGLTGHSIDTNAVSMYNLLDDASLNKIAENAASRVWSGFVTFGSATAGIFGIMVIIRVIKLVIDTAIHGYALHTDYGWSMHLLGAIWSSLTHLLLHLASVGSVNRNNNNDDNKSPSAPEAPPALPTKPPVLIEISKPNENARSNIESATINFPPDTIQFRHLKNIPEPSQYQTLTNRLKEIEQIPTNTSEFVPK